MIAKKRLLETLTRVAANLFILFFICRSIFICWPFDQQYNPRHLLSAFSELSISLALDANLALFSPNPPNVISAVKFAIYFDDGTTEEWKFPGDKMLPWDSDNSYQQYIRNALFWSERRALIRQYKYEARYIAKRVATAEKHPVRIYFYRASTTIAPPETGIGHSLMQAEDFRLIYSYLVKPGDLE